MRKIVIFDEFNEIDLKPSDLLHKYIQLTEEDVIQYFVKKLSLNEIPCPGCHSYDHKSSFLKFSMQYVECARCGSLYISPRPDDRSLDEYYSNSEARRFWRDELSKMTKKKRKQKIIKPRFEWILDCTAEYLPGAFHIVDINTDQYGYIEEMIDAQLFGRKTLLNPFLNLDKVDVNSRIKILRAPLEGMALDGEVDVVTLFEIADRTANVDELFGKIYRLLRENGLCFMTDILISGFDLQSLWDKAENIFPPDRLNIFSVEGLKVLFDRHHFDCLEFSTPGILDLEIVEKTIEDDPEIKVPRFTEYLLRNRSDDTKKSFQEFLQQNLLSSYGRILLQKK